MMTSRTSAIVLLLLALTVLTGCENLGVAFKYGDWKWEHEFKLKEIDKIEININEVKDKAVNDTVDPTAPVVAQPQQEENQQ